MSYSLNLKRLREIFEYTVSKLKNRDSKQGKFTISCSSSAGRLGRYYRLGDAATPSMAIKEEVESLP